MTARVRWAALIVVALIAPFALTFLPSVTEKFAASKNGLAAGKNDSLAGAQSPVDRSVSKTQILSQYVAIPSPLQNAPWEILRRTTAIKPLRLVNSTLLDNPRWGDLLAQSAPKARELFQTGMKFLRSHRFVESRLAFQTLVRTFPGDEAEPLAYWAMGLSYCKEGGEENLMLAADQFLNWLIFFPGEKGLEDLAEAAQINIALIEWERMNDAKSEKDIINAAKIRAQALTQFLQGYPDSQAAQAAQSHLAEIHWYLAGVNGR